MYTERYGVAQMLMQKVFFGKKEISPKSKQSSRFNTVAELNFNNKKQLQPNMLLDRPYHRAHVVVLKNAVSTHSLYVGDILNDGEKFLIECSLSERKTVSVNIEK